MAWRNGIPQISPSEPDCLGWFLRRLGLKWRPWVCFRARILQLLRISFVHWWRGREFLCEEMVGYSVLCSHRKPKTYGCDLFRQSCDSFRWKGILGVRGYAPKLCSYALSSESNWRQPMSSTKWLIQWRRDWKLDPLPFSCCSLVQFTQKCKHKQSEVARCQLFYRKRFKLFEYANSNIELGLNLCIALA